VRRLAFANHARRASERARARVCPRRTIIIGAILLNIQAGRERRERERERERERGREREREGEREEHARVHLRGEDWRDCDFKTAGRLVNPAAALRPLSVGVFAFAYASCLFRALISRCRAAIKSSPTDAELRAPLPRKIRAPFRQRPCRSVAGSAAGHRA